MARVSIIAVASFVILAHFAVSAHIWGRWTAWSHCSATCDGSHQRSRECFASYANGSIASAGRPHPYSHCLINGHELHVTASPPYTYTGSKEIETRTCSAKCPVVRSISYHWEHWTSWTHCNATCDGTQYQLRACTRRQVSQNKTTQVSTDISHCSLGSKSGAYDTSRRSCGPTCSVWSPWSDWSACSASCDDGTRFRGRHCINGDSCAGAVFDQDVCNEAKCLHIVDGGWGDWGSWGKCSASCGLGYNVRYRTCDNPAPQDGGSDCAGKHDQVRVCPVVNCPIPGGWGDYSAHQCTVTCGVGVLVSTRKCDNPPPQYGGSDCVGSSTKFDKCVNQICSVDGQWSGWSRFTDCAVVCGNGHIRRTRTCSNPPPIANGTDCIGEATDIKDCDKGQCPPDIEICDKTLTQRLASTNTTSPINCSLQSLAITDGFSLVESSCNVPADKSKWRLGIKIHNNCEMIPLYTPVGCSDTGVHVKEVGVMADCFQDTLQMMTQACNNDIVMKSFNLTDAYTSVHMLLFEN